MPVLIYKLSGINKTEAAPGANKSSCKIIVERVRWSSRSIKTMDKITQACWGGIRDQYRTESPWKPNSRFVIYPVRYTRELNNSIYETRSVFGDIADAVHITITYLLHGIDPEKILIEKGMDIIDIHAFLMFPVDG